MAFSPVTEVPRLVLALLGDDSAQAITEYAIIAATFGVLMVVAMVAIQHAAGNALNTTQNGLSSGYVSP